MCKIICPAIIVTFIAATVVANKNKDFHAWYEKITDQKFNCPAPIESELDPGNDGQPILKVVDCDDPSAIYRYDYKVQIYHIIDTILEFFFSNFHNKLSSK